MKYFVKIVKKNEIFCEKIQTSVSGCISGDSVTVKISLCFKFS